jgi:hypothetical protein
VLWTHAAEANVNAARVGHAAEANVNAARVGHALHLRTGELTFEDKSKWYEPEGRGVAYLPSCNLHLHSLVCEKEKTQFMHGSATLNTTFIKRILVFLSAGARSSKCLLLIAVGEVTPSTIAPLRPVLLLCTLLSWNTAHSIMLFLCPLCTLACNVHTRISIRRQPESCTWKKYMHTTDILKAFPSGVEVDGEATPERSGWLEVCWCGCLNQKVRERP